MAKKKVHASRKTAGKPVKKKHSKAEGKSRTRRPAKPRSGADPALDLKRIALEHMQWVHASLDKLVEAIPPDKAMYQVAGTDNHLLWTIGHLATAYSWFASLIDGQRGALPEPFMKLFAPGTKPAGDAAAYPSLEEVKREYRAAFARIVEAAGSLTAADFGKPTLSDSHGFAGSRGDVLLKTAWHDGWHAGQISTLRRALGLPATM